MKSWRQLFAIGSSAVLLGGCAETPVGGHERVPLAATLGREIELFGQQPREMSVAVSGSGSAHVAAVTANGTLQHLVVDLEGSVDRKVLGQVNQNDLLDLVVGSDGTIHVLVETSYLRFSSARREDVRAGGCERIAATPAHALCSITLDAAGVPSRVGLGRFNGLDTARIPRATKLVISRFEERTWSPVALLDPDSDWDVLAANIVAANDGGVHVLYLVEGPVSAPPLRRVVRFATVRLRESNGRPPERFNGVDVWELVPGTEPAVIGDPLTVDGIPDVATYRRRYGLTQPAVDGAVIALARPAGRAYTMLRAPGSGTSVLLSDASDLLLVQDGRLLRELPARSESSGWTSFVLSTVVAAAGAGRFHVVSVSKDDLLGFAISARYLQVVAERWSTPLDLGRVSDQADLVKLGAGEDGRAFVILPATDGRVIGRWITSRQ